MRRKTKICPYCQCVFFIDKWHEETQFYCSTNHQKLAWKKSHPEVGRVWQKKRWRELHPIVKVERNCVVCSKLYLVSPKGQHRKYCSWRCRCKNNQTPENRARYRLTYRQKHLDEIKTKDAEYKSRIRFGVTSKTFNKQFVLLRDNKTCQLCRNPYQVIHHIKYSGKVEDLVCLCRSCHALVHKGLRTIGRSVPS